MDHRRGTSDRWRRPAAAAVVLGALAAGLAAWWARASVPRGDVVAAASAPAPTVAAAREPAPPSAPSNVVVGYVRPPAPKAVAAVGLQAAAEYRRRARYPRSAQPLTDDEKDPIARDREVSAVESRGQNGVEPTLRVFPAASGFEAPEPAVVFAELTVRGRPAVAREIHATFTTEDLIPLGEVAFHDDGNDGDAAAGDGRYTAVVDGAQLGTKLATSYLVQVVARVAGDEERKGAASFLYSSPHARLTGTYRDALVDGSLHVGAEIDVTEAGRFHLEATLYGPDGVEKIAWAQAADWFEPGPHWLDLAFYGLILRERGLDGPYVLRFVALSTTTEMPNAKSRIVENAYWTQPYAAASFTDRPFDDPQLLEAARRIEADPMPRGLDAGG
jgi:hypothetical protein